MKDITFLQYGEGNFLRAFFDFLVQDINNRGKNHKVCILKPIKNGNLENFHKQNFKYSVLERGILNNETINKKTQIDCVSDVLCVYENYNEYIEYHKSKSLKYIISNTTEAGIVFSDSDKLTDTPPNTYPAKLTQFLYKRYQHFKGDLEKCVIILPCELIENNGLALKSCVEKYITLWNLESDFANWVKSCNFINTLVDRIVTGYPIDTQSNDKLLVACEPFFLWVIESKPLPIISDSTLPVVFCDDLYPYRQRKVALLNGAHTSLFAICLLMGIEFVNRLFSNELLLKYINTVMYDEIIPTLSLDETKLKNFAKSVLERFSNPFINHAWSSISLNSISKWKVRVLPTLLNYVKKFKALPKMLVFSYAALIYFYINTDKAKDDADILDYFKNASFEGSFNAKLWDMDLNSINGFYDLSSKYYENIKADGIKTALKNLLSE